MTTQLLDHAAAATRAGVRIRALGTADAEACTQIMASPGVVHGTMQVPWTPVERRRSWIERTTTDPWGHLLGAELVETGELVGNVGLHVNANPRTRHIASLGMSVGDAWQGRGIGTALLAAALHLADDWLALRRVELEVYTDNAAGIALYERFGFEREGTLRDFAYREGTYVDALTMARHRTAHR